MDRVVTVNLGGNAYQLEEAAYAALSAYLAAAERTLAANPDKSEIVRDLEAAIADRISGRLHAHKTVVSASDMEQTLKAMGVVEGADPQDGPGTGAGSSSAEDRSRRLYRLREGAVFAGVCSGLAAFLRVDAGWLRFGAVIAALFAPWFVGFAYAVAMFAIPSANSPEEWSAAHGLPATAQQVIDEARRRFREVNDSSVWGRRPVARPEPQRFTPPAAPPAGLGARAAAAVAALVLSAIGAAATLAFAFVVASLALHGSVLGHAPILDGPIWIALLGAGLVFAAFTFPLQNLRQRAFRTMADVGPTQAQSMDALVSFGFVAIGAWAAWTYWAPGHHIIAQTTALLRDALSD